MQTVGDELSKKILTFEDVFKASLMDYEKQYSTRDRSSANYAHVYNRCIDKEFAKLDITKIDSDTLSVYCLKVIGSGESRMNIMYFRRNFLCLLNLIFKYAFRKRIMDENPVEYLDKRYYPHYVSKTSRILLLNAIVSMNMILFSEKLSGEVKCHSSTAITFIFI